MKTLLISGSKVFFCRKMEKDLCDRLGASEIADHFKQKPYMRPKSVEIQIIDCGNADFKKDWNDVQFEGTGEYLPPEAALTLQCDEKLDIWSAGCTVMELYTGDSLFPIGLLTSRPDLAVPQIKTSSRVSLHLALIERIVGTLPEEFLRHSSSLYSNEYHEVESQRLCGFGSGPLGHLEDANTDLANLVRRLLSLSPQDRPAAADALSDVLFAAPST